jgi:predicted NAD/FAD-binding protein
MRIAVIGSGISGMVAAYHLSREHEVTVYEAGSHIGGHAHTVDVDHQGTSLNSLFAQRRSDVRPSFLRMRRSGRRVRSTC